jgi:hypothetical protein
MFNLQNEDLSFIIINSEKEFQTVLENYHNSERLYSVLDSKEFSIFKLKDFKKSKMSPAYLAVTQLKENDSIRAEALHILEFMDISSLILKYKDSKNPILLEKNGHETPLLFEFYPNNQEEQFYVLEGLSFNFKKDQRFFFPKNKSHLKQGMVVEYLNDDIWKSRKIDNLDVEYNKMYSLLMKYDKLRIPIN